MRLCVPPVAQRGRARPDERLLGELPAWCRVGTIRRKYAKTIRLCSRKSSSRFTPVRTVPYRVSEAGAGSVTDGGEVGGVYRGAFALFADVRSQGTVRAEPEGLNARWLRRLGTRAAAVVACTITAVPIGQWAGAASPQSSPSRSGISGTVYVMGGSRFDRRGSSSRGLRASVTLPDRPAWDSSGDRLQGSRLAPLE
jgi:hypothetical protein